MVFGDRLKNAWNAFFGRDPTIKVDAYGSSYRPDRFKFFAGNARAYTSCIYNQIAVDCSSINIRHVQLDETGRYKDTINDSLNRALMLEANIDQTGRDLIRDLVITMLEEGVVAVVPVETDKNPYKTDSYRVKTLRVGRILEWFPKHVRVEIYNDIIGRRVELIVEKRFTAIIENPFYLIMNETNSTLKRLLRTLSQLDRMNDETSAGKFDLIVQVPYSVKSSLRKNYANERRKELENQLSGNKFGIAYIDSTEKVIQLNRSLENNLWVQAKELQTQLYNELGFSQSIFDGSADDKTTLNYYNRTIEPIMSEIIEQMDRKWISKTAASQGQAIRFFRDPFKLVPVLELAEIADKVTRNEIMTSNEVRSVIGLKPSDDPKADELRNSNLNHPDEKEVINFASDSDKKETMDFSKSIKIK